MTARRSPWNLALLLSTALACGDSDGKTSGDASTGEPGTTTGATATTGEATDPTGDTGELTTDPGTTDQTSGTTTGDTSSATTSTTGPTTTDPGTTGDPTGATETTGVDLAFERFKLSRAAGPCAPDNDCDGFIELLASGTLRVEKFGELGDPVIEVEVSAPDLAAAALVFTAPELITLLDSPDPLCDPPTDIFETMEADIDGALHDATTTACDQAPLTAARDMAQMLAMTYAP